MTFVRHWSACTNNNKTTKRTDTTNDVCLIFFFWIVLLLIVSLLLSLCFGLGCFFWRVQERQKKKPKKKIKKKITTKIKKNPQQSTLHQQHVRPSRPSFERKEDRAWFWFVEMSTPLRSCHSHASCLQHLQDAAKLWRALGWSSTLWIPNLKRIWTRRSSQHQVSTHMPARTCTYTMNTHKPELTHISSLTP